MFPRFSKDLLGSLGGISEYLFPNPLYPLIPAAPWTCWLAGWLAGASPPPPPSSHDDGSISRQPFSGGLSQIAIEETDGISRPVGGIGGAGGARRLIY